MHPPPADTLKYIHLAFVLPGTPPAALRGARDVDDHSWVEIPHSAPLPTLVPVVLHNSLEAAAHNLDDYGLAAAALHTPHGTPRLPRFHHKPGSASDNHDPAARACCRNLRH